MGLRILITNNTLDARAGSELYVRDLAIALLKRGHTPIAFSTTLGDVARELRSATIPVIDNLEALTTPPDIIHGQHHVETMIALLHFPGTPAIYFCHGWVPWEEAPPKFPRILRYVAVDHTCRDRLVFENGIPEDRIRVLFNFVDLERFKPRGPLPTRPKRALIFSNETNKQTDFQIVREACDRTGITLDVIGVTAGRASKEPEKVLGDYDIVFAKGRSAIEAMAVGTAVVLYRVTAIGSMVTTCDLDRLRSLNFGIRAIQEPISVAAIEREIARYDANDAARIAERIRSTAALDSAVEDILSIYQEAIAEFSLMERRPGDEQLAASAYLRWLSTRLKENGRLQADRHALQSELDRLRQQGHRVMDDSGNQYYLIGDPALEARSTPTSFAKQIEQYPRNIEVLIDRIKEKEQNEVGMENKLAAKEFELARITNTLGWRLLSYYGPIKYRFLLPVYRRLRNLFSNKTL